MISTHRHEYGDRWVAGPLEVQFFKPRLWRLGWRSQWVRDRPEPFGGAGPITGWVVALPVMAVRGRLGL